MLVIDGSEIWRNPTNQLRLVVYPNIYIVFSTSQVVVLDFFHQQSSQMLSFQRLVVFFSSTKRIEIESYTTMRRASGRTQRHLPLLLQVVFPREEEHPIHEQEPPVSSHKWNQACLEDVPPTSKGKWRLIGIHIHYTYKGKSRLIGIHIHYTYHRNPTIWKSSTTERCSLSSIPMSGQKAQRLNLSICQVRKLRNQRIRASSHPETSQKHK